MRNAKFIMLLAAAFVLATGQDARASFLGLPKALKPQLERIQMASPTLAPMAHTMFCMSYPDECGVRKIAFRGKKFELTPERWTDLRQVNAEVNRSIVPQRNLLGLAGEKWVVSPSAGDCNDYAVTKRHQLLARGWPSRTLLLAEVVTRWGEHHLVLVIRAKEGDFVLDNMSAHIRPWSKAPYQWVRIQSPRNPKFWSTVRSVSV
jgi:predicted transglutaminase-like cysteine proteinase